MQHTVRKIRYLEKRCWARREIGREEDYKEGHAAGRIEQRGKTCDGR